MASMQNNTFAGLFLYMKIYAIAHMSSHVYLRHIANFINICFISFRCQTDTFTTMQYDKN